MIASVPSKPLAATKTLAGEKNWSRADLEHQAIRQGSVKAIKVEGVIGLIIIGGRARYPGFPET